MQKIIGSIFIIVAGTGLGFYRGKEMQERLSEMQEVKRVFLLLKSHIRYTRAPFASAFKCIAQRSNGICRDWLLFLAKELEEGGQAVLQTLWSHSIDTFLGHARLKETDTELIKGLGANMGHLDAETQLGAIELFLEQWEELLRRTSGELSQKRRLSRCLGVMGGIFLVILLV